MLKSITIENFFSFGKPTKIELNKGLNVLVGINASGKSTVIRALQLLYETVCGKGYEKLILEDWGGFEAVKHQGIKENSIFLRYEFDKELINTNLKKYEKYIWVNNPIYSIQLYKSNNNVDVSIYDEIYSINDGDVTKFLFEENIDVIFKDFFGNTIEVDSFRLPYTLNINLLPENSLEAYPFKLIKKQIELLKTYFCFDTSLKSPIRQPAAYTTEDSLLPTGENLTTVLQRIKNYHSLSYEKIEELLQKVNPNFKDISFDVLGSRSLLTLREKKLNRTILPEHISDGTLRFLLLLAITCNPQRGSLICLDEPDMGLHPDMISTIATTLKEAAQTSQFIISTHSPLLLNEFDLEDIIVIEKDANNQSIVKTFSEDDFADWSNNYLAGQLWLMGKLGGKRW